MPIRAHFGYYSKWSNYYYKSRYLIIIGGISIKRNYNLTEGDILGSLIKLSLPIMGTAFIQMLYNLVDMFWLGRLGTNAVAAVGTGGFINWFGMGLTGIAFIGANVNLAQAYGKGDTEKYRNFLNAAMRIALVIGFVFSALVAFNRVSIISFFDILDSEVVRMAEKYLSITGALFFANFISPICAATYNSKGNSFTPFVLNSAGLVANIIFDPLLIFGFGKIPAMGVAGAAWATALSRLAVLSGFVILGILNKEDYIRLNLFKKLGIDSYYAIFKVGFPSFIHTAVMSTVGMQLTKIINAYGAVPVAVYSIGSQVESITWMTTEGFASAISTFVAQNYGAKKFERLQSCCKKGMLVIIAVGIVATGLLVGFSQSIFEIFSDDPAVIELGISYLTIMGAFQVFFAAEIGISGCFSGLGLTIVSAVISVIFNIARIPFALFFSKSLGANGVWAALALSGVLKGVLSLIAFAVIYKITNGFRLIEKYWRRTV